MTRTRLSWITFGSASYSGSAGPVAGLIRRRTMLPGAAPSSRDQPGSAVSTKTLSVGLDGLVRQERGGLFVLRRAGHLERPGLAGHAPERGPQRETSALSIA